ncbi:glycosyltransferase family 2 protein [Azospirillum sp. ST 5-10]|uniref:glycosyltransferase family 2 protein n=1 Tax=unclassified Azospirillum TaxID=2630922 RepID=UPI003F4A85A4
MTLPDAGCRVAVCILTFRRPKGLQRLLDALERLSFAAGPPPDLAVTVIDNSPEGTAADQVARVRGRGRLALDYVHEPRRGIACARNTAVEHAAHRCDFVAFIDDDEEPEPQWLDQLLAVQRRSGADVVTGPVLARFAGPVPPWIADGKFFDRPRHGDGERIAYARTGNVLIGAHLFVSAGLRFDEALSLVGGEDSLLFRQAVARGFTIVWADHAVVHEWVPPTRANPAWLVKRWYRTGRTEAMLYRKQNPSRLAPLKTVARGAARVVAGSGLLAVSLLPPGRGARVRALRRCYTVCRGAGMVASAFIGEYREYEVVHSD